MQGKPLDPLDNAEFLGDSVFDLVAPGLSIEQQVAINEALSCLTPLQLEVVSARLAEEPWRKIAREQHKRISTLQNVQRQALYKLKQSLGARPI